MRASVRFIRCLDSSCDSGYVGRSGTTSRSLTVDPQMVRSIAVTTATPSPCDRGAGKAAAAGSLTLSHALELQPANYGGLVLPGYWRTFSAVGLLDEATRCLRLPRLRRCRAQQRFFRDNDPIHTLVNRWIKPPASSPPPPSATTSRVGVSSLGGVWIVMALGKCIRRA